MVVSQWYRPRMYHQQAASSGAQFLASPAQMGPYSYAQFAQAYPQVPPCASKQYCMQPTQQQVGPPHFHSVFSNDFLDFPGNAGVIGSNVSRGIKHEQLDPLETNLEALSMTPTDSDGPSPGVPTLSPNLPLVTPAPIPEGTFEWMKKHSYQLQPNSGKTRTKDKYRVVYSDYQRMELEKEFYYNRYITIMRKSELARTLNLTDRQIKIWFQNRRAKDRRQTKKREEQGIKEENHRHHFEHQLHQQSNIPSLVSNNQLLQFTQGFPPTLM